MIRLFDFMFSFIGLLILSPIMAIIYAISLLDTGSPIFKQERVGKDKKPFNLYKFRTMHKNTKSVASHLASSSSITKFGLFLRKSKLDELPQLINVFIGDMSLVGARPCLFNQIDLINEREKRGIYRYLPGITGLGQINNVDMSTPNKLADFDAKMYKNFTLLEYFKYILATIAGNGKGDAIK